MFRIFKNSKKVEELTEKVETLIQSKKDDINDVILILRHIQETNNESLQWKKKQSTINNEVDLAIEKMNQKIVELEIDPQF